MVISYIVYRDSGIYNDVTMTRQHKRAQNSKTQCQYDLENSLAFFCHVVMYGTVYTVTVCDRYCSDVICTLVIVTLTLLDLVNTVMKLVIWLLYPRIMVVVTDICHHKFTG